MAVCAACGEVLVGSKKFCAWCGAPATQPGRASIPSAPPPVAAPAPFAVGARVLVQWADGNRYPGIVQQLAPGQCLVVFPDGQQRWVDHRYLSEAR